MSSLPPPLPPPQAIPKRGLSGCAITGIVAFVLFALVLAALGIGGYAFVQKAGGRTGIKKTAIAMANPDYDVIDFNETDKTITVRHKKSGKTATFPVSRVKDGRIDPGEFGLSREEAEGTGAAPEWLRYPRATQVSSVQLLGITTLMYHTDDTPQQVIDTYKSLLGEKGMQVSSGYGGAIVVADDKANIQIAAAEDTRQSGSIITIAYHAK